MEFKEQVAAFTIVQEEPFFLPKWLSHYAAQVGRANLYVLVHGDAGWLQCLGSRWPNVTVVPVHRSVSFDHDWLRETVARFQAFLLQSYRWALFAEADELVAPTPVAGAARTDLREFVAALDHEPDTIAVRAVGYEVVHRDVAEPPLAIDPAARWLADRGSWYWSTLYSKTLLSRVPLRWERGFHRPVEPAALADLPLDDRLTLVHLHKVDFRRALDRSRSTAARRWAAADLAGTAGIQNRITDEDDLRRYFATDVDTGGPVSLAPIPDLYKDFC